MKKKIIYICQDCGAQYPKWSGQCSECGVWNSIIAEEVGDGKAKSSVYERKDIRVLSLDGAIQNFNRFDILYFIFRFFGSKERDKHFSVRPWRIPIRKLTKM